MLAKLDDTTTMKSFHIDNDGMKEYIDEALESTPDNEKKKGISLLFAIDRYVLRNDHERLYSRVLNYYFH